MGAIASQITSLTIVYSTVYSGADSPREPHALAWGPSSFHIKIFRVERTRLKTVEKTTDSLQILHLPIH